MVPNSKILEAISYANQIPMRFQNIRSKKNCKKILIRKNLTLENIHKYLVKHQLTLEEIVSQVLLDSLKRTVLKYMRVIATKYVIT